MRSVLLMVLLSITQAQRRPRLPSCPASCVVCSEDALICHRLSNIIEAPDSTQALMLTDGSISSVDQHSLSNLTNITVLGLSHNAIVTVSDLAFRSLSSLHTLLLDHNRLTSQVLGRGAFSRLARLEVLDLGNNNLTQVYGSWFQGTRTLRILQLEGNLLTSLVDDTFSQADLRQLETLDLSDNLLSHLGRNSFRGLVSLRSLDLSRNSLRSAPVPTFSYLSWLGSLNLDLNTWNCTCELRELAAFLSSYMQAPDKVLYNGRRLVCVSADNPAVSTVLELTEANCVPPNQNITVRVAARSAITAQRYVRDLAIAAVVCFFGGVGLTLLVLFLVFRKGFLMRSQKGRAKEEKRAEPGQTVTQWDVGGEKEGLDAKLMLANSSHPQGSHTFPPWGREAVMLENNVDHLRSRMGDGGGLLRCPNCGTSRAESGGRDGHTEVVLHTLRQGGAWPNGTEEREAQEERSRHMPHPVVRSQVEDFRGERSLVRPAGGQASHPISRQQKEELAYRHRGPNGKPPLEGMEGWGRGSYPPGGETMGAGPGPDSQTLSCGNCHRTVEYNGYPNTAPQHRLNTGRNLNANQSNADRYGTARERGVLRSVTFDLERPGAGLVAEQRNRSSREGREDGTRAPRQVDGREQLQRSGDEGSGRAVRKRDGAREENSRRQRPKSSRSLKVKLILNPLRKSKVHPRKSSKERLGEDEGSRSKKARKLGKSGSGGEKKGGKEKDGKGGGGGRSKHKSQQSSTKRSKTKDDVDEDEDEEEEEESPGDGGPATQSKSSSKRKKTSCKPRREGEPTPGEGDGTVDDNAEPAPLTALQSDPAGSSAIGQQMGAYADVQGLGLPHLGLQGNGSVLQRSSSQPLLFPGAGGRGLPFQTGSLQNLQAPNLSYTGALQPRSGSLGPPSLLTNHTHSSPLLPPNLSHSSLLLPPNLSHSSPLLPPNLAHSSPLLPPNLAHSSPLHPGQPGSLPVSNSVIQPFSQPPPNSLNQRPRLGSTLTQAAGLQAGQGYASLVPQAPVFQSVQAPGPLNRGNLSNNNSLNNSLTLALVSSAAPQSAAPQSTAPQSASYPTAPQSIAPQSTAPQSTAPQSIASHPTAPQSIAPQSTAPQSIASHPTAPQSTAPQSIASHPTAPQSIASHPTAPQSTAPQSTAPQSTAPQSIASHPTAPQSIASHPTAPQSTAPHPTAPQSTAPQSTASHPTAPQSIALQSIAPQSTAPQSTAPQSTAPQSTASHPTAPQSTAPQSIASHPTAPQSIPPQSIAPQYAASQYAASQYADTQSTAPQSIAHQSIAPQSATHQYAAHQYAAHQSTAHQSTAHQSTAHQSTYHQSTYNQSADHQSTGHQSTDHQCAEVQSAAPPVLQEYLPSTEGSSPKRRIRLVLPEQTNDRPPTALDKKIR